MEFIQVLTASCVELISGGLFIAGHGISMGLQWDSSIIVLGDQGNNVKGLYCQLSNYAQPQRVDRTHTGIIFTY